MSDDDSRASLWEIEPWSQRPPETAALLNPAFLGALVTCAAWEHEQRSGVGLDVPTAFLVPPLVLHSQTRAALPRDARTHLSVWITRYPILRAGFPHRTLQLVPLVREALRLSIRSGVLVVASGILHAPRNPARLPDATPEVADILNRARTVGRWLAANTDRATVFALLGVRP
jgi:hypothetical protein